MMSKTSKCREMQEHFPLLFNGSLNPAASDEVRSHLEECDDCKSMYAIEERLFRSAEAVAPMIVGEHPAGATLDAMIYSPDRLSSDERENLLKHLSSCEICAEAVTNLGMLPADINELVTAEQFSIMADPAGSSAPSQKTAQITPIGWRRQAKPLFAFAAAAMIMIVAVYFFRTDRQVEMARVEANFPSITRSADSMLLFESGSEEFVLAASVHVGPEEGHSYSLSLIDPLSDSVIFRSDTLVSFDSLGFVAFEQTLLPGSYELRILDIERGDTVVISRPFEVIFSE